ncbi:beta-ketoacyl synthase N-terminal-like domain-containing protein [Gemmobacter caeruleus]|uniref:beta-ketoacyl synthase N-terminal-like domain-containing protein n=1 Tax=Gemmobacter caeruleus TaxID=2595004 RepID=UPI0011EC2886|nr:beta-ketoacyl synthase N-terminal-like domain-containing protein [Gemmobacter caeruleus]
MTGSVVITGIGVVVRDAMGLDAFADWLMPGGGLPDRPEHFDTSAFRAGNAYAVNPDRCATALARLGLAGLLPESDRDCAAHGLLAAAEALAMAGLDDAALRAACGCVMATTSGGMMDRFADAICAGDDGADYRLTAPPGATAEVLARQFGLQGPFASFSSACASSPAAFSYALSRVRRGDTPLMLVGGSDRMRAADFAGFNALRAMDRDSCRPFDQTRRGMVIGDGAAMLVIEDEAHALARGARPLARLREVGLALDAHHITHPSPDGLARAMRQALHRAGLAPDQIAYVNCHGTGTPVNDKTEVEALAAVFADESARPLISSTKGATGHLLGSAGAIEAVITILALRLGCAPAMATTAAPEPTRFPMPGPDGPAPFAGTFAMSNSLGFGGINSSLIFEACAGDAR